MVLLVGGTKVMNTLHALQDDDLLQKLVKRLSGWRDSLVRILVSPLLAVC